MTLQLDENGDLAIASNNFVFIEKADEVTQMLNTRLRTFLGEWFLNIDLGMPYFQEIFVKNVPVTKIKSLFIAEIVATPGLQDLVKLDLNYNNQTRQLEIDMTARIQNEEVNVSVVVP